jgi:hypothetical protein
MALNLKFSSILSAVLVLSLGSCMGQLSGSGKNNSAASHSSASHRSLSVILKDLENATAGDCTKDDDCVGEAYKRLPCGQMSDTYFYSKDRKDSDDIERIDNLFNEFDAAFSAQNSGMVSTCEVYEPIIPICSLENKCEAPPPPPGSI